MWSSNREIWKKKFFFHLTFNYVEEEGLEGYYYDIEKSWQ